MEPMVFEETPCKEKGHFFVEQYLQEKAVPFTVFRCGTSLRHQPVEPSSAAVSCVQGVAEACERTRVRASQSAVA